MTLAEFSKLSARLQQAILHSPAEEITSTRASLNFEMYVPLWRAVNTLALRLSALSEYMPVVSSWLPAASVSWAKLHNGSNIIDIERNICFFIACLSVCIGDYPIPIMETVLRNPGPQDVSSYSQYADLVKEPVCRAGPGSRRLLRSCFGITFLKAVQFVAPVTEESAYVIDIQMTGLDLGTIGGASYHKDLVVAAVAAAFLRAVMVVMVVVRVYVVAVQTFGKKDDESLTASVAVVHVQSGEREHIQEHHRRGQD